jgi:hypothetical protein
MWHASSRRPSRCGWERSRRLAGGDLLGEADYPSGEEDEGEHRR